VLKRHPPPCIQAAVALPHQLQIKSAVDLRHSRPFQPFLPETTSNSIHSAACPAFAFALVHRCLIRSQAATSLAAAAFVFGPPPPRLNGARPRPKRKRYVPVLLFPPATPCPVRLVLFRRRRCATERSAYSLHSLPATHLTEGPKLPVSKPS
jgi:hypothetical protein